jgi:hypothetical protein
MRKTYLGLLAILALAAIVLLGIRSQAGFNGEQLAQLDLDWGTLEVWAQETRPNTFGAPGQGPDLAQAVEDWHTATKAQQDAESHWQRCLNILEQDSYHIKSNPNQDALGFLKLGEALLTEGQASPQRVARTLLFARHLQQEGHLLHFMVGMNLARQALDACDLDPTLIPLQLQAPPPKNGELFAAMCRDHVRLEAHFREVGLADQADPISTSGSAEEQLHNLMRTAYVRNAKLYHPLRDEPQRFGEVLLPEKPSRLDLFITWLLQLEEGRVRTLESLLTVRMDDNGKSWAQLVSDWERVLGT